MNINRLCEMIKSKLFRKTETIEDSIQDVPDTVPELSEADESEQNRRWVSSPYAGLLSHYRNKYIAVADRKVVAYGRDPEKVLKEVEKRPHQQKVIFMYMDPKDRVYSFT